MEYFYGLITEQEIKARYKQLAKEHHPDLGGCSETMKIINDQYEQVLTGRYQKDGKSITEIDELLAKDAVLREKLNQIILCEDIYVEVCGRWIWVTGNTKKVKDILKAAKFIWANKKKAWYWHAPEDKSKCRRNMALEDIRSHHGSVRLNSNMARLA